MSKLICLLGVIGAGKDYRAKQFVNDAKAFNFSMEHINFADTLREIAWDILNWKPENDEEYELFKQGKINISGFGFVNGRKFLQNLGASIRKNDPDFWVRCWKNKVQPLISAGKNIVCSDARHKNEIAVALKMDTTIGSIHTLDKDFIFCNYKSERYDATNAHESEVLAQRILADGYNDGESLSFDYLWNLIEGD